MEIILVSCTTSTFLPSIGASVVFSLATRTAAALIYIAENPVVVYYKGNGHEGKVIRQEGQGDITTITIGVRFCTQKFT